MVREAEEKMPCNHAPNGTSKFDLRLLLLLPFFSFFFFDVYHGVT